MQPNAAARVGGATRANGLESSRALTARPQRLFEMLHHSGLCHPQCPEREGCRTNWQLGAPGMR
eukprot:3593953-Alexandrium_andersonii.AAC.1